MRGIEAYGLWRARAWAEWLAILSGGLYLPVEVYALLHQATLVREILFPVNVGIVADVGCVRLASAKK